MARWKKRQVPPARRQWVEASTAYPPVKTFVHSPDQPMSWHDEKVMVLFLVAIVLIGALGAAVWLLLA